MIREARARVGGRDVRYLEAGAGWPVLLIHAFPVTADMWRPQLERVPEGWRFVAPDVRGFGPDGSAAGAFTMDDVAEDLGAFMDHLKLDRAVIGGLSMGGYITLALGRRSPERFGGMILADTKADADSPEARAGRRKMIELARSKGAAAVADEMLPKLLSADARDRQPELAASVRSMAGSISVEGLAAALEAMMGRPDSTPGLSRINCPVLILVGGHDEVTPEASARAMERHIERSRVVVLPDAGHLSNLESPEAFSLAVADFLTSNM
jgi:pimeloyl-ACP methyl ester carboxylesterase